MLAENTLPNQKLQIYMKKNLERKIQLNDKNKLEKKFMK
jgi:hypothetical protein